MIQLSEIMQNVGIEVLTPMQEVMLKAYHTDRNIVLLSPTGSGKTLAFLLPLVMSLNADKDGVQTLVLTPSRELALQIDGVFRSLGTPFKAMSCYGGRSTMEEHRIMNNLHPSVIIATPGRINDHLKKNNIDASAINTLVIDEFDKCLELGFQDEMSEVVTQLTALQKKVLLSATEAVDIPDFVAGTGNRDLRKRTSWKHYIACCVPYRQTRLRLYLSITVRVWSGWLLFCTLSGFLAGLSMAEWNR